MVIFFSPYCKSSSWLMLWAREKPLSIFFRLKTWLFGWSQRSRNRVFTVSLVDKIRLFWWPGCRVLFMVQWLGWPIRVERCWCLSLGLQCIAVNLNPPSLCSSIKKRDLRGIYFTREFYWGICVVDMLNGHIHFMCSIPHAKSIASLIGTKRVIENETYWNFVILICP